MSYETRSISPDIPRNVTKRAAVVRHFLWRTVRLEVVLHCAHPERAVGPDSAFIQTIVGKVRFNDASVRNSLPTRSSRRLDGEGEGARAKGAGMRTIFLPWGKRRRRIS